MTTRRTQRNVTVAAILLVAGTLSIPGAAAEPPPAPPPPNAAPVQVTAGTNTTGIDVSLPRAKVGTISGQVRESGSKRPLRDVQVIAYFPPHRFVKRTSTHRDGTYRLSKLPGSARGYVICFRDPAGAGSAGGGASTTGWAAECLGNRVWSGVDSSVPANAKRVRVRPSQETKHVDASLQPGGALTGRVLRNGSGLPLNEVDVFVHSVGAPHFHARVYTGRRGQWRVSNLPSAPHGYQVCFDTRSAVHVNSDGSSAPQHAMAPRCVGTTSWHTMPKPANGESIPSIPAWKTVHFPRTATRIAVRPGSVRHGIGVRVRPAGAVAGRLVDRADGTPVWAVWVSVFDDHGRFLGRVHPGDHGGFTVRYLPTATVHVCVDPGTYYAGTDPHGSYHRTCYRNVLWTGRASRTSGAGVHVVQGKTHRGVVVPMPRAGTIEGRLTSAVDGQPVIGAVTVFTGDGSPIARERTDEAFGGKQNYFVFGNLPPSRTGYLVCATSIHTDVTEPGLQPHCYADGRWDGASRTPPNGAKRVRLGPHDHLHLKIMLPVGGAISGRLTHSPPDQSGYGVITLFDNRGHRVTLPFSRVVSDAWSVSGLNPGHTYRVCFQAWLHPLSYEATCYSDVRWYRP